MEKEIYAMLKAQIHPDQILDDIAEMFYSAITAERHLYPKLMNRLAHYNSFQQLIDAFDREGTDEEILIFGDVLDMIEQELDDTFDEGEDRVKEQLMQEPMASAVLDNFRKRNVLMVQQKLQADQIEQMYVTAFRQYDRLKEGLEERILALSPLKAYYRGEVIWQKIRKEQNILMDDNEMVEAFQKFWNQKELEDLLCLKYYQVIQFGRHYEVEEYEEVEETDPEEDDESTESFFVQRMPEILTEAGDMREQSFEYVCELYDQYTGRRIYSAEEGGEAYWVVYGDEFEDLIYQVILRTLQQTLEQLQKEEPQKLENFAAQYGIPTSSLLDGELYLERAHEFGYYCHSLFDKCLYDFGDRKAEEVFEVGKTLEADENRKLEALSGDLS
ncbi:MAG TPA: hypothetical protein IAC91_09750 [Candidatus Faecimorpha stercoravium]|nr:hypothetical protein [Candidatus Faecimorpha stercoravium]